MSSSIRDYRVIVNFLEGSFKIGNLSLTPKGQYQLSNAAPYGETPEELIDSFADYEQSFRRDFIFVDRHGIHLVKGDHPDVALIRRRVKAGKKIAFHPVDYENHDVFRSPPPKHYRIGFELDSGIATIFYISSRLNIGSTREILAAGCLAYSLEDFLQAWFMYQYAFKMNMCLVTLNARNGRFYVDSEMPFTVADWENAQNEIDIEDLPDSDSSGISVNAFWKTFNDTEKYYFKVVFYNDPGKHECGIRINKKAIVKSSDYKKAPKEVIDKIFEFSSKRYAPLGLPIEITHSPDRKKEIAGLPKL